MTPILLPVIALAALFQPQEIALPSPEAEVFLAPVGRDTAASPLVLDKRTLTAHPRNGAPINIALPERTTAIDVADIDSSGETDIVAIVGSDIHIIPFDASRESRVLPNHPSVYSEELGLPYPRVIAVRYQNAPALALPTADSVIYLNANGEEIATISLRDGGTESKYWPWYVSLSRLQQFGPGEGLEFSVSTGGHGNYRLPTEAKATAGLKWEWDEPITRIQPDRVSNPSNWSRFQVSPPDAPEAYKAYCAADPVSGHTLVHFARITGSAADVEENMGPERRYPGLMVSIPSVVPDFNNDGYGDALFWTMDDIGSSIDSAMRTLAQRTWTVRLMAHVFDPKKGRFDPRAVGMIALELPLEWWFGAGEPTPIRNLVIADFNGDGHSDIGGSTNDHTFSVWTFKDGFSSGPTDTQTFNSAIDAIAFTEDVDGSGRDSIGLRTPQSLHVLYATTK